MRLGVSGYDSELKLANPYFISFHLPLPFVFERSKLVPVTKHDSINVLVDSKFTISSNKPSIEMMENALHNRVPVSTSGRTLAEILSLSHSDNLKLYSINGIKLVWRETMVGYSRREPSMMDLLQEIKGLKEEIKGLKEEMKGLKEGNAGLKFNFRSQESLMLDWQVANLVFQAYGNFVWTYELTDETKARLLSHNIMDFSSLYFLSTSSNKHDGASAAEVAARAAYHTIDISILHYSKLILSFKERVVEERAKTAPPSVSQNDLDEYLNKLGANFVGVLSPIEERLFGFLRKNSIISNVR